MERPLASIAIPCRNQADYLRSALRSLAAQTVGPLETIVIDDGSTDDTSAVARDAGAIVLSQPTAGVSAARNAGLRRATAQYVIVLDADDELEPEAVESGVAFLEAHPDAWMVARCCQLIDGAGSRLPTDCVFPESEDVYGEWLQRNFVWTPGAAMFRREAFAQLGGFPVDPDSAADYAVYLQLARLGRVGFDPRTAVRYRQHGANMSADPARMLRATLSVLRRERQHVPPGHATLYTRGVRAWRIYYGEAIIHRLRADLRARHFGRQQIDLLGLLLRECRSLLLKHVTRKAGRVARGLPPAELEPGRFASTSPRPGARTSAETPR
jgi:alpha-1,6-rhamnosyltransferase